MIYCRMAEECRYFDAGAQIPGIANGGPLCEGCRNGGQTELNLLRYDYVDLSQLLVKKDVRGGEGIFRPKPESSPPMDMLAYGLRGEIAYAARVTTMLLRRYADLSWQDTQLPVREGFQLDCDTRILVKFIDELVLMPARYAYWRSDADRPTALDGPQALCLLLGLHRRARKLAGTDPRAVTLPGYCPGCGNPSLRRHEGNLEQVWCVHCKRKLTYSDYARSVQMQLPGPP